MFIPKKERTQNNVTKDEGHPQATTGLHRASPGRAARPKHTAGWPSGGIRPAVVAGRPGRPFEGWPGRPLARRDL
eukprot:NODE_4266_length_821_cov_2.914508_g3529_i0.p3 GENE.NODE_4266_length_821_cov_2.914508_g3529_i0~~NODE_4266_length_821_cov_2.914508_g3529_i0.p3  ORF type:complete len:75 (+),score=0.04 NODE_4266_length_821_cov_2.914508_g3529_i0:264-488(+)